MGIIKNLKEEVRIIKERDPAIHSSMEVLLYPSFKVMIHYRLAHKLYLSGHYFWARYISQRGVRKTGIEIHPGAQIGKGFFIDHGNGVIIGETTIIGDNVTMYQGVTLGGTGKDKGKRHPTLGDNVLVGSGAKVLGPFKVGDGARIASNAVVLREVPPNSTAVGVPAQVVRVAGKPVYYADDVDQIHMDNPVQEELNALTQRIQQLETELKQVKETKERTA